MWQIFCDRILNHPHLKRNLLRFKNYSAFYEKTFHCFNITANHKPLHSLLFIHDIIIQFNPLGVFDRILTHANLGPQKTMFFFNNFLTPFPEKSGPPYENRWNLHSCLSLGGHKISIINIEPKIWYMSGAEQFEGKWPSQKNCRGLSVCKKWLLSMYIVCVV